MWGGKKAREQQKKEDRRYAEAMGKTSGSNNISSGNINDYLRAIADRVSGYTGRFWKYNSSVGYQSITVTVYTNGEDVQNYLSDIKYDIDNAVRRAANEVGCPYRFSYEIEFY